jgi:hypothetical protein
VSTAACSKRTRAAKLLARYREVIVLLERLEEHCAALLAEHQALLEQQRLLLRMLEGG